MDSGLYDASLQESEMHYLLEHWGEIRAEQQHEENAVAAVAAALNESTEADIVAGVDEFRTMLGHGFHPSKAQHRRSIQTDQAVHPEGRTPMVLVPWDRDRPGVGARAASLGAAEMIARRDLSELRLSAVIDKVLGDPRYQKTAALMASRLQARDAVATP